MRLPQDAVKRYPPPEGAGSYRSSSSARTVTAKTAISCTKRSRFEDGCGISSLGKLFIEYQLPAFNVPGDGGEQFVSGHRLPQVGDGAQLLRSALVFAVRGHEDHRH